LIGLTVEELSESVSALLAKGGADAFVLISMLHTKVINIFNFLASSVQV